MTSFVQKHFLRVLYKGLDAIWVKTLHWHTCEIPARNDLGGHLVKPTYLQDEDTEPQRVRGREEVILKFIHLIGGTARSEGRSATSQVWRFSDHHQSSLRSTRYYYSSLKTSRLRLWGSSVFLRLHSEFGSVFWFLRKFFKGPCGHLWLEFLNSVPV